jgi:hypothetical protein
VNVLPLILTSDAIPVTFEEAQRGYINHKTIIAEFGNGLINATRLGQKNQPLINDWSDILSTNWYIQTSKCTCPKVPEYTNVKSTESDVFELCPQCMGTVKRVQKIRVITYPVK